MYSSNLNSDNQPILIENDNESMAEAIQAARETLPEMLSLFSQGQLPDFSVKVQVEDEGQSEHFWLSSTELRGKRLSAS